MYESYVRSLLRVSVAQICQTVGWDAIQLSTCDLLSDILHRHIQKLARSCHRYSELYGRTDPVLSDVGQAFRLLGVNINELEDYINHVEPLEFAHQTPLFPISKNNMLQFPQPGAQDTQERREYIPDHMPPLVPLQEEEEEQVPADFGTSAEAMQVPLHDEEEEIEDEETVNDENCFGKRRLSSPGSLDIMPCIKKSCLPDSDLSGSPEWGAEPREPLCSLNSQQLPHATLSSLHAHDNPVSIIMSSESSDLIPSQSPTAVLTDAKPVAVPIRKSKISSPGKQRVKSPKRVNLDPGSRSLKCSPKTSQKETKKSPGQTKSPKIQKSPKTSFCKVPNFPGRVEPPLAQLSDKPGKENIQMHPSQAAVPNPEKQLPDIQHGSLELPDYTIDDSIAAVIARARAERDPKPFSSAFGSEPESDCSSSTQRLTISEPMMTKLTLSTNSFGKDMSTPLPLTASTSLGISNSWTMDDSINEVIRKLNQGGACGVSANTAYLSSPSASPPTPEPLLKIYEEKKKLTISTDFKKKLKKELKTKIKKKEKEKKDKEKEHDKGKNKDKDREKNKDKEMEFSKESKLPWKDICIKEDGQREIFKPRDFNELLVPKVKSKDGSASKKEREKHKDKKKDKEKRKKDKDKRNKSKEKTKDDRQKASNAVLLGLQEDPAQLFSPTACIRVPPMLTPLPFVLSAKPVQEKGRAKEKEKKKDKKEKKKKKEKEQDKKEKDQEKEERKKEKKEREKEKEKHKPEKVKPEPPVAVLSPVIPRLTLRVGAGQDKIVINKVVPMAEARTAAKLLAPKIPTPKVGLASRSRTPPRCPLLSLVPLSPAGMLLHSTHMPSPAASSTPGPSLTCPVLPTASSSKAPVCSVVTETVSTYVIRDEWGNQIWICPACNKPDDGSPMIGCDDCDDWYHWPCVGLVAAPPENVQWFCVKCDSKRKDKKYKKRKPKAY